MAVRFAQAEAVEVEIQVMAELVLKLEVDQILLEHQRMLAEETLGILLLLSKLSNLQSHQILEALS